MVGRYNSFPHAECVTRDVADLIHRFVTNPKTQRAVLVMLAIIYVTLVEATYIFGGGYDEATERLGEFTV